MATGIFTIPTAVGNDTNPGSQRTALLTNIAIRSSGEVDASQWQDLGMLANAELHFKAGKAMSQGKRPVNLYGYEVEIKAEVLSVVTAVRTALNLMMSHGVDVRMTSRAGDVYTLLYTDGINLSLEDDQSTGTDINSPKKAILSGGGSISAAVYVSCYAQGS